MGGSFASKHEWICNGYGLYSHKCTANTSLNSGCILGKRAFSESTSSGVIIICIIWSRLFFTWEFIHMMAEFGCWYTKAIKCVTNTLLCISVAFIKQRKNIISMIMIILLCM
jgi:hypothetical protein